MSDTNIRARAHTLTRAEWEARFKAHFAKRLQWTEAEVARVVDAELEAWPEFMDAYASDDWRDELPEEAVDENLTNWTD